MVLPALRILRCFVLLLAVTFVALTYLQTSLHLNPPSSLLRPPHHRPPTDPRAAQSPPKPEPVKYVPENAYIWAGATPDDVDNSQDSDMPVAVAKVTCPGPAHGLTGTGAAMG